MSSCVANCLKEELRLTGDEPTTIVDDDDLHNAPIFAKQSVLDNGTNGTVNHINN